MNKEVLAVRDEIQEAIAADKLELPTLPEIAMQVRKVAGDDTADCNSLMHVISEDPAVSAHMLRVVNSPLMRRSDKPVTDLRLALMQMGFDTSANLAVGIAIVHMFMADNKTIGERMRAACKQSTEVAGLCQVICRFSTSLQPEIAMLAGLIHNIGVLPVLKFAQDKPTLVQQPVFLDMAIHALAPELGDQILKHWNFDENLLQVPSQHLQFNREVLEADYVDVVTFAVLQAAQGTDSPLAQVDPEVVTANRRLNLGAANDELHSEEMQEKIQEASSALG